MSKYSGFSRDTMITNRLLQTRKNNNHSQTFVRDFTGVCIPTIISIEKGRFSWLYLSTVEAINKYLEKYEYTKINDTKHDIFNNMTRPEEVFDKLTTEDSKSSSLSANNTEVIFVVENYRKNCRVLSDMYEGNYINNVCYSYAKNRLSTELIDNFDNLFNIKKVKGE